MDRGKAAKGTTTKTIRCSLCGETMDKNGYATQVFRRGRVVVTVTGIPAVRV